MPVLKVVELLAESDQSWEAAAQEALTEASKTISNIRSLYIKEFSAHVDNQKITRFRVNAKVSFVVEKKK